VVSGSCQADQPNKQSLDSAHTLGPAAGCLAATPSSNNSSEAVADRPSIIVKLQMASKAPLQREGSCPYHVPMSRLMDGKY
jgi:hypothetical protein